MKKELFQKHISYLLTMITACYILFLACGYFSIFTGQHHQPHIVVNIIIVGLFLIGLTNSLPQKQAFATCLGGVMISVYFAIRFFQTFDFALGFKLMYLGLIIFPAIMGAIFAIVITLIHKRKKATV